MSSKYALSRENVTLSGRLVASMRSAILAGDLKGGERLSERSMTEMFGVSRSLVREATQVLAAEGLITVVPHKGPTVTLLDQRSAEDLYRVRAVLEGLACQEFVEHASDAGREELFAIFERLKAMLGQDDADALVEAKNDFYRCLLAGARNEVLDQMFTQLNNRIVQLRRFTLSASGRFSETLEEIGAVIDAIRRRDGQEARHLAEAHVAAAANVVIRRFAELEETQETKAKGQ
ncbi:GntR family transcriptional regulator [Sulfitobacter sp. HNIBRBA3233]|uniref:GntR family transcriptional regulator n=1 Tax=Sulfitobacter marinivivus TaxID=3158558 RepID=UPI0032DF8005